MPGAQSLDDVSGVDDPEGLIGTGEGADKSAWPRGRGLTRITSGRDRRPARLDTPQSSQARQARLTRSVTGTQSYFAKLIGKASAPAVCRAIIARRNIYCVLSKRNVDGLETI